MESNMPRMFYFFSLEREEIEKIFILLTVFIRNKSNYLLTVVHRTLQQQTRLNSSRTTLLPHQCPLWLRLPTVLPFFDMPAHSSRRFRRLRHSSSSLQTKQYCKLCYYMLSQSLVYFHVSPMVCMYRSAGDPYLTASNILPLNAYGATVYRGGAFQHQRFSPY